MFPSISFPVHYSLLYIHSTIHSATYWGVVKETVNNEHSFHSTPYYVATERLSEVSFNKGNRQKTIT